MSDMTSKSVLLMALLAMPILIVFVVLGRFQQGLGAWACLATVLIVARYRWELRKSIYFWVAIAVMLFLQIPIVLYVPWNAKGWHGWAKPLAFVNGAVGLGLLKVVEMIAIKKKDKSDQKRAGGPELA
jgi:hypothetical protein